MTKRPNTRTVFELGDFNDDSVNNEPSMTDPSQDESIDDLVARMLRGEAVRTNSVSYDTEISHKDGPGAAFDALPPHRRDGFDISDAGPILENAAAALAELEPKAPAAPPAPVVPPAPPAASVPPDLKEGKPN